MQVFSVGTPKSGTTSIANLFSKHYRYEHEAERKEHVKVIFAHYTGKLSDDGYVIYLRNRDKRLWLDVESNCFLGYRVDLVYRALPNLKIILTIREPKSWLNSILDNNINFPISASDTMKRWHTFFFSPENFKYSQYEETLIKNNLYPLDAYLTYWRNANKLVIDSIPSDKLLVLKTSQISDKLTEIASFLCIDESSLSKEKSRMNVTEVKYAIINELDPEYVTNRINEICSPFMNDYGLL